jgi:hypothetical protein
MSDDKNAQRAAARFFLRIAQADGPWRDENTLPIFPLLLTTTPEMLEADAAWEAAKCVHPKCTKSANANE